MVVQDGTIKDQEIKHYLYTLFSISYLYLVIGIENRCSRNGLRKQKTDFGSSSFRFILVIHALASFESSHRDLLTKYLFERGYLPGKFLCVRGIGVSWKIVCGGGYRIFLKYVTGPKLKIENFPDFRKFPDFPIWYPFISPISCSK